MVGESKSLVDGRRLRSERTRQYIIEAYLALLRQNPRPPTAAQIAERAGYSVRSLFERFPDLLSLSLAAADYAFAQANTQAVIRNATADRDTRIRTQVETRARTCEDWLPLWRALVLNQQVSEELRLRIRRVREALTDFESWARMREAAGLSFEEACTVWIRAIDRLLPPTPGS